MMSWSKHVTGEVGMLVYIVVRPWKLMTTGDNLGVDSPELGELGALSLYPWKRARFSCPMCSV